MRLLEVVFLIATVIETAYTTKGNKGNNGGSMGYGHGRGMMQYSMPNTYNYPIQNGYYRYPMQMQQHYSYPMMQQNFGSYNGYSMTNGMYNNQFGFAPASGDHQWVNYGLQGVGNLYGQQQLAIQPSFVPIYQSSYTAQGINMAGSGLVPAYSSTLPGTDFGQSIIV